MSKLFLGIFIFLAGELFAQDLNQNLSKVATQYAESYLQPFINAYGAGINSGFFHPGMIASDGANKLHISFSIESIGSFIPANEKSFSAFYHTVAVVDTMGQSQTVNATATVNNAPTIFGSKNPATAVIDINDTMTIAGLFSMPIHQTRYEQTFGSLASTDVAPLLVPQLNIGTFFNTEIFMRWLPPINIGNYGKTSYLGLGVRHNFGKFIKNFPVNIYGEASYQNFSINDSTGKEFLSVSAYAFDIQLSKSIGAFEVYGAVQYEGSSLNVNYSYLPSSNSNNSTAYGINISFNLNGANSYRIIAGSSYSIGNFYLNADLNFSSINVFSLGIGYNIL